MFTSEYHHVGSQRLPSFTGKRVMMMPVIIGDPESFPDPHYQGLLGGLSRLCSEHAGEVGYLTIDEKLVRASEPHRLGGLHVDGVFRGGAGGWGGGGWGGGGWGSTGMLTVASHAGCRAWRGEFPGAPDDEGGCEHLRGLLGAGELFPANEVYWLSGMCVHESVPQQTDVMRQFVRLSMPSTCPWFEGYSVNPLGVLPTGPILPRRPQMDRV